MIDASDVRDLLSRIDLLALVGADVALKRESATSWAGPCPWCGGRDRLYVKPYEGRWRCRRCDRHGDAIAWLRELRGLTFLQALEALGGVVLLPGPRPRQERPALASVPSTEWRTAGEALVARCEGALWTPAGAEALAYLHGRGLSDATIRRARLGYAGREVFEGLQVRGPSVAIPWYAGGRLWALKVRLMSPWEDGTRYLSVTWADPALRAQLAAGTPTLYGADTLPDRSAVILVEGELDSLLLAQEAGDLVAVATLGSAGKPLDARAAWLLLETRHVLIAYDLDDPGEEGARKRLAEIPGSRRIHPPTLPGGKDITDAWRDGADLRAWVLRELDALEEKDDEQPRVHEPIEWPGAGEVVEQPPAPVAPLPGPSCEDHARFVAEAMQTFPRSAILDESTWDRFRATTCEAWPDLPEEERLGRATSLLAGTVAQLAAEGDVLGEARARGCIHFLERAEVSLRDATIPEEAA